MRLVNKYFGVAQCVGMLGRIRLLVERCYADEIGTAWRFKQTQNPSPCQQRNIIKTYGS